MIKNNNTAIDLTLIDAELMRYFKWSVIEEKLKKENEVIQKIVDEKEKDLFEETAYWPQKGKGEGLAVPKSSTFKPFGVWSYTQ